MYLVQFVLDFPKLILIHVSKRSCTIPTLLWQVGAYCIFGSMNLQGMLLQVLLWEKSCKSFAGHPTSPAREMISCFADG